MQATLQITNADENLIKALKGVIKLYPQAKVKVNKEKTDKEKYEFLRLKETTSYKTYLKMSQADKKSARDRIRKYELESVDEQ